jgi:tRNA-dihydrouridine synthase A
MCRSSGIHPRVAATQAYSQRETALCTQRIRKHRGWRLRARSIYDGRMSRSEPQSTIEAPCAHRFCVAPMMDATDRHCRYFMRLLSRRARLYTEMITTGAVLHGNRGALLGFDPLEHPLALQLGGSEPRQMAECAAVAEDLGYDEVNINVGCPSDRVRSGRFGACLMAEPERVADCVARMHARVAIPITVKTRIGIDDRDRDEDLFDFVDTVHAAGCDTFIVHARKAWLHGLSPRENREVPPLRYPTVYRLKRERPRLRVVINGGITSLTACAEHLLHVDGVMLGREIYRNPYLLADVDPVIFGALRDAPSRHEVVRAMLPYASSRRAAGEPLHRITRHMLGLFQGCPGARAWRRHLSEHAHRRDATENVLRDALGRVPVHGPGARVA